MPQTRMQLRLAALRRPVLVAAIVAGLAIPTVALPGATAAASAAPRRQDAPPTTVALPTTTTAPPTIDAVASRFLGRGATAVSVAVWRDGHFVNTQAWGRAKTTSRFQLASISKMLTAIATVRLAAQGKVDLNARIAPALAKLGLHSAPGWGNVTVRQLLSHTSGAPMADSLFFGRTPARSCTSAAASVLSSGPLRTPGTSFRYSNANFCLLGLYLQAVTGKTHEVLVNELVWAKAGVTGPHLASTGQRSNGDVAHPVTPGRRYLEPLGAAGRWMASPSEVVAVVASLTPTERAALRTSLPAELGTYGLGTRLLDDGSWGHTGTLEASRTVVWVEPDGTIWAAAVSGRTPYNGSSLRDVLRPSIKAAMASA